MTEPIGYYNSYDAFGEPQGNLLQPSSGGLGAMTSKEAYARVVTGLRFLIQEYEWRYGTQGTRYGAHE
jgi:hypothetical protein